MKRILSDFEHNQLFTEEESWMLFKLAAIAEAVGWTLLLLGIYLSRFIFPGNQIPVQFAGHVHGILFLLYALAALGLYPTMHASRRFAFVALLASVPPYGSILFEQWAVRRRSSNQFTTYRHCVLLHVLSDE